MEKSRVEELKNSLEKGEELLWSGTPENFTVSDKTHQKGFVKRAVIALIVGIALSVGYYFAAKGTNLKPAVFIVLWVICIYAPFSERISALRIKKLIYGLTDQRVVILNDGTLSGFEYSGVKNYEFKTDEDGHNCLLVGENAINLDMYKWRLAPIEPIIKNMDTGVVEKAGLYAIPDFGVFKRNFEMKVKK